MSSLDHFVPAECCESPIADRKGPFAKAEEETNKAAIAPT
jgi:hypothetical protein